MLKATNFTILCSLAATLCGSAYAQSLTNTAASRTALQTQWGLQSNQCRLTSSTAEGCAAAATSGAINTTATVNSVRSDPGTALVPIDVYNKCRYVDNTSTSTSAFVPFNTAPEWDAFNARFETASAIPGANYITPTHCAKPTTMTVYPDSNCQNPSPASQAIALPYWRTATSYPQQTVQFTCTVPGLCNSLGSCSANQPWTETVTATYTPLDSDIVTPSWKQASLSYGGTAPAALPAPALPTPTTVCVSDPATQTIVDGEFLMTSCTTGSTIVVTLSVKPEVQCHGNACNSSYYSRSVTLTAGVPSTQKTPAMAVTYTGNPWLYATVVYDGNNIITLDNEHIVYSETSLNRGCGIFQCDPISTIADSLASGHWGISRGHYAFASFGDDHHQMTHYVFIYTGYELQEMALSSMSAADISTAKTNADTAYANQVAAAAAALAAAATYGGDSGGGN